MDDCNCQMIAIDELKALLNSDQSEGKERAVEYLVTLLTSKDEETRLCGYKLFKEGMSEALFCSCLDYRSLVGGFTHALFDVVTRSIESWATSNEVKGVQKGISSGRVQG